MEKFFKIGIIFKVISIVCFINAIFFILIGIYESLKGIMTFYKSIIRHEWLGPGIYFAKSLDAFTLSIVFIIFAFGIFRIFVLHREDNSKFPAWLNAHSFSQLKMLLWETILITLIVQSISKFSQLEAFDWNLLILPIMVLILSVAYFFVKKGKADSH